MSTALCVLALALVVHPVAASARIGVEQKTHVPKEFLLTITVVFCVVSVLLAVGTVALAVAGAMAAATIVITVRQYLRRRTRIADTKALGSYIGQLAADIDSGAHHFRAVQTAAAQMDADSSPRVRMLAESAAAQARFGHSPAHAFAQYSHDSRDSDNKHGAHSRGSDNKHGAQVDLPQLHRLAVLWSAAGRHGIALAGLLDSLHRSIDGGLRHRSATAASLQGPQATAVILTCLPLAGIVMGMAMGAQPITFLLTTSLGGICLVAGVGLSCAGFVWSQRITNKAVGEQ